MLEQFFSLLGPAFVYIIIGMVMTMLLGGRDPLDAGPPIFVIIWPVLIPVGVGFFLWERLVRPLASHFTP